MPQLSQALDELYQADPDLDPAQRLAVADALHNRPLAGLFRFTNPDGFIAASDAAVVQVLSGGSMLIVTQLRLRSVESIRYVHMEDGSGLLAFVGSLNDDEVVVAATVEIAEGGPARRLVHYVSQKTGIPIT